MPDSQRPATLPAGACLVPTTDFRKVQLLCRDALAECGWVLVDGPGGLGKTTAARAFCDALPGQVVRVHLAAKAQGHAFLRSLLAGLGVRATGPEERLLALVAVAMRGRRLLIYVEEADQMNAAALRHLRFLYDDDTLTFAVLLVGVSFKRLFATVPEVESRISARVPFRPIPGRELVRTVRKFHPLLENLAADTIKTIDREHCAGNWRKWAIMVRRLAVYCDRAAIETPNERVVGAALASVRSIPA